MFGQACALETHHSTVLWQYFATQHCHCNIAVYALSALLLATAKVANCNRSDCCRVRQHSSPLHCLHCKALYTRLCVLASPRDGGWELLPLVVWPTPHQATCACTQLVTPHHDMQTCSFSLRLRAPLWCSETAREQLWSSCECCFGSSSQRWQARSLVLIHKSYYYAYEECPSVQLHVDPCCSQQDHT